MLPAKFVLVPSPPMVRLLIGPIKVTVPVPASEPIDCAELLSVRVAPAATVTALFVPSALLALACSTPSLTSVAPVYEFELFNDSVPVPFLVSDPDPEIT